jgi:hypothetical protein
LRGPAYLIVAGQNVLVMNLEKLLELLFVFFAYLLRLLLRNEPEKGSRFAHLSNQAVPA